MPLFLIETNIDNSAQLEWARDSLFEAAVSVGATLVESRNTVARDRLFLVFEYDNERFLRTTILLVDPSADFAEVRLVGATVEEVRRSGGGSFLTEWDFPDDLTMDAYLTGKAEKTPLYDEIRDMKFKRTYVREDIGKCLCFYDAACEEDVILARKTVDTPVDRISELE